MHEVVSQSGYHHSPYPSYKIIAHAREPGEKNDLRRGTPVRVFARYPLWTLVGRIMQPVTDDYRAY